jgi:hypothetical protein
MKSILTHILPQPTTQFAYIFHSNCFRQEMQIVSTRAFFLQVIHKYTYLQTKGCGILSKLIIQTNFHVQVAHTERQLCFSCFAVKTKWRDATSEKFNTKVLNSNE